MHRNLKSIIAKAPSEEGFIREVFGPTQLTLGIGGMLKAALLRVGIVQCKAWNTYKVGIKVVRELFGVMASEKIRMGMVITSGDFTSEAEEFGRANKLKLVSGRDFIELIKRVPEDKQQHLLSVALEGNYSTPTCPQCDVKMVRRESLKGRSAGGYFWGCVNYPRCKQTLVYKE